MVGKNNTQERFRRNATKDKRYTLKKLSVGLASVALGTVLFLNGAETVSAEAEVVDPNSPAAQPVQETFHFNYLNQATGARLDGFFGDYVNANEAEKAFRHYANEQGYTLLNVRLEGHTFTADVAVEQDVQPEVEQEAQPAESTFQFIYRNKETGEKFDSFFGDYVNENEAEKDFRHYANQHGYTLLNVRQEGHTFTADVAVEQEAQPAESAFQFIYRDKETGEKFDSFFGDYENENEAEKDFRHYANQHGYTLLNVHQNGHTFTADVARDSQSEEAPQTPEVEKGYSYALNFDGRTESANLGEFDSEEQAELALRIFANEQGYELSNLRLEGRTFYADAKVATEADEPSESTDRYLQEAKDRARGIINELENLFDTQKPSYLERIEDADSVAAVEAIVEDAQNYVNEGKGGENGQATEEPEKPEYTPEQNPDLVTYDLQITDQNGRTQIQRVTFPSRELALNYISQLVRSYEKAGVVLNEERSDVEGKDNTFILVFEEKQAEEPAKADYTVKVIIDGEERQSQALPDTTRDSAIDYAERLAKSYEQDGFTYNHLDAGLPSDTVIRIELSSPELDVPSHTEDAPAPEALDVTKAEALDIIAGLDLDDVIKDNLVYEINQAEDEAAVGQVIAKAYKIVAAGLAEEPTPELDLEEEAGRELDATKAEALDAIAGLEHLSEEEKAGFVDRINETTELGEVNRLVGLAFKRNIENFPEPTPELDPEEEAGRELDAAKAEALDAIAGLEHLSEEEKAGFVERINETTELGEVNRLVGLAFKRNIENFPESTPELDPEEEAGRELDAAKAEALDAIAGLEHLSEEEKAGFVDRINETTELGEVNRLVGLAFKRNIENFPESTPELDPEEEAGRELDAAKAGALEDIANLDYFTADEKQDLVDRINDYDNTGDIDFIVSKAIEENDARHKAAEALKAHKEKAIKDLKAKGFNNEYVFDSIRRAKTSEGVDSIVENLDLSDLDEEAGRELDAAKAGALADIAGLDYYTADEKAQLENLVNNAENVEDIAIINEAISKAIEENDARHKLHKALIESGLGTNPNEAPEDLDELTVEDLFESGDFDSLAEAKFGALEDIAGLDYFTAEEKQELADRINGYDNTGDIDFVVSKAIEENDRRHTETEAELKEAKDTLRSKIEAVVDDEDQKATFLEELEVAKTLEDVQEIEDLVDIYLGVEDAAELEDAKDRLRNKVASVVEDEADKVDFLQAIDDAKTIEDLVDVDDKIEESLEADADDIFGPELATAKAGALADISGLDYYTAEEKAELEALVNNVENVEDIAIIDEAVSQAIEENDRRHTEAKQEALEELHAKATEKTNEIDQRIDLTEEEKDLAHTVIVANYEAGEEAINNATTAEEVAEAKQAGLDSLDQITIDGEAKQEAQNELHRAAQAKENEIEERIDLTEDEKTEAATKLVEEYNKAVEAINSAETNDDVTTAKDAGIKAINDIQLTPAAKQEAQNELHKAAQAKENEIEERIDLTEDEKTEAATKLVEEYNKAVEAINSAETNDDVTTAKDAGIKAINDIQLTPAAKQEAQNELHKAAQAKENEIEERIDLTEDE
ncbi:hypothetical protein B8A33_01625, partial [Dolosigranulum pigrum]|uniref:DUF1542 domain-containing protein n=2 Tax=Dolosigranulum pigrum TaxID=29394 RepID=UPI000DC00493